MGYMRTIGWMTARGLASLVIAYALIVKLAIGAAATTVTLPVAGLDPVICLTDHAGALADPADGSSVPVDTHHCDDCSLGRLGGFAPVLPVVSEADLVARPSSTGVPAWMAPSRASGPATEAWGLSRAQRGPPLHV